MQRQRVAFRGRRFTRPEERGGETVTKLERLEARACLGQIAVRPAPGHVVHHDQPHVDKGWQLQVCVCLHDSLGCERLGVQFKELLERLDNMRLCPIGLMAANGRASVSPGPVSSLTYASNRSGPRGKR